jgi:predicted nucleic acid-binding protein
LPDEAVSNASPLIVLARAGHLDLLGKIYPRVHLPQEVLSEVEAGPDSDPARQSLKSAGWLTLLPPKSCDPRIVPWNLGPGEAAVLTHALAIPGAEALLDDRAGRTAARALGIPVRGTLGLLVLAKRRGLVSQVRPILDAVASAGLFVTPALRDACLRASGE